MILTNIISLFEVTPEEMKMVNHLRKRYKEIDLIYQEILGKSQKIIEDIKKVYLDINDGLCIKDEHDEDFNKEKQSITNLSTLYFAFKVCLLAALKGNKKNCDLSLLYNECLKNKKEIINGYDIQINHYRHQIEEFKKIASQAQLDSIEKTEKENKIEEQKRIESMKNKIILPPSYGTCKGKSTEEYVMNELSFSMSDIEFDSDGNIIIPGSLINKDKMKKGLNGHQKPRFIKNDDKITLRGQPQFSDSKNG